MAIGIDTSKWKPRKIKGTPAAKVRNIVGIGVISAAVVIGAVLQYSTITEKLRKKFDLLYEDPIVEVERRQMIASGLHLKSGDVIRKQMKEDARLDLPYNSQIVKSKYFATSSGMDESLSEFQEKKQSCSGPKTVQKVSNNKPKPKKKIKRLRGQKDIRSVLRSKNNDLVSFTKDFNEVCVQSGIDVDSEELQIAIALSKSLSAQDCLVSNYSESTSSSSPQERTRQIRTTLLEYGFKVPEIKNTLSKNKKTRKHKKNYKLLLTTETERQQIITDKYSQILLENIHQSKRFDKKSPEVDWTDVNLYFVATHADYETLKDDKLFYIENIIEKNDSKVGSLLKDWSKIPGRPQSPALLSASSMDLSEIACSQEEIDIMLSGSLKAAKQIVKNKKVHQSLNNANGFKEKIFVEIIDVTDDKQLCVQKSVLDLNLSNDLPVTQPCRCLSPDIFDEELPSVFEVTEPTVHNCLTKSNIPFEGTCKPINDSMDLTECIPSKLQQSTRTLALSQDPTQTKSSQENNVTKRKSNDFMEITECVGLSSSAPKKIVASNNIDLTATPEEIIKCDYVNRLAADSGSVLSLDLTQSSSSNDDTLPFVHIGNPIENSQDETYIMNENEYIKTEKSVKTDNLIETLDKIEKHDQNASVISPVKNDILDTIKEVIISPTKLNNSRSLNENNSDEHVYQHSDHSSKKSVLLEYVQCNENSIDLTQSSNSSDENSYVKSKDSTSAISDFNNLGKRDNVSIDYDEFYEKDDEIVESAVYDMEDHLNDSQSNLMNCSQKSDIFIISDSELNYSLRKSKHEQINNFNLGGLSVIDSISNVDSYRKSNNAVMSITADKSTINLREKESFLPEVPKNILIKDYAKENTSKTPLRRKHDENFVSVETPTNHEYIVKADQVTPMLDYASMSTPDRNKELDKYGLKPFKRKRAIQLLTHLYNQTHPVVECHANDSPSPSKKFKQDTQISFKSCKKLLKSPNKIHDKDDNFGIKEQEFNIYRVTNETPDIRDVACSPEEWVFQKREKAKLHSCRVPLHVALHNYVACRSRLREAILRYEPVDIDVVHRGLAADGHKYDPKDLLKFMDKKCITVKTSDNNSRNRKQSK